MKKPTVFIHTNDQQLLGAIVAAYAFKKMSATPDAFEVKIINLKDYRHLTKREGRQYLRKGKTAVWHNRDLQSFSPLRFLPPQLMGYQEKALITDPDVFALTDIYPLLTRNLDGKAILCCYVDDHPTIKPFYATSVMLLDCAKLRHWDWDRQIDEMFNQAWDYGKWISLKLEPEGTVGHLEPEWNHLDTLTANTKLLHTTERSTQPWKTGLPVDFDLNYTRQSDNRPPLIRWVSKLTGSSAVPALSTTETYLPHPDVRQERFFFTLLKECLERNLVTEKYLKAEMKKNHLRQDAFQVLDKLLPFRQEELQTFVPA